MFDDNIRDNSKEYKTVLTPLTPVSIVQTLTNVLGALPSLKPAFDFN